MAMNSLLGKTMAIWMLAGRPLVACVFFLTGFLPDLIRNYLKRRRRLIIQCDETVVKPVGKYRLHD